MLRSPGMFVLLLLFLPAAAYAQTEPEIDIIALTPSNDSLVSAPGEFSVFLTNTGGDLPAPVFTGRCFCMHAFLVDVVASAHASATFCESILEPALCRTDPEQLQTVSIPAGPQTTTLTVFVGAADPGTSLQVRVSHVRAGCGDPPEPINCGTPTTLREWLSPPSFVRSRWPYNVR